MFQFTIRVDRMVLGMLGVGVVAALSSVGIVRAGNTPDKSRTFSCSSGTACVQGDSRGSKTWGVYGVSKDADGVHGETSSTNGNSALAGIVNATTGHAQGVFGRSPTGHGLSGMSSASGYSAVYGTSSMNDGVDGISTASGAPVRSGIHGNASNGYGVSGTGGFVGVYGYGSGSGSIGVEAEDGGASTALSSVGDSSNTGLFVATNKANGYATCQIDPKADLTCTGKIGAPSLREWHRNGNDQHVLSYASQSATATIEDVGTARMVGGVADVHIDPAFAAVTDRKWYYVFLTPLGDTRGLYVSVKTPAAFEVRETEHGRSSLEFDYRIVAHPLDADNDRLPPAPAIRVPANVNRAGVSVVEDDR
ncbi:MAG TPA: hypothetical protein VKR56_00185 [Candidatus Cybelea sp.]|nr:hypothetical protein [Candidatus Cybelea sp.]